MAEESGGLGRRSGRTTGLQGCRLAGQKTRVQGVKEGWEENDQESNQQTNIEG